MDELTTNSPIIAEIKSLLENARKNVAQQVNTELLTTYWQIGRIIVIRRTCQLRIYRGVAPSSKYECMLKRSFCAV